MKTASRSKMWLSPFLVAAIGITAAAVSAQEAAPTNSGGGSAPASEQKKTGDSTKLSDNFKFFVEIGGQFRDISGERPTKFEEFGQIRKGAFVRRFAISSNPAGSPDFFRASGKNVSENDQQYMIDLGRYGLYRTKFEWSDYGHLYSRGAKTLFTGSGDTLTVDDSIQTALQNAATAAVPGLVQGYYNNAYSIDMRSKRNSMNFTQMFQITQDWTVKFNWNRQHRSGNRSVGSGSYERIGTATGDTFRVMSIELPVPIDSTTDVITFGTRFTRKNWGISFDYSFSKFNNDITSVLYDNPFRITDLEATGSGGVFDRMKMARGQLSMEPDNTASNISISAFVDLAKSTRLAGAWSWGFWKQNDPFLPYTLNSLVVTGVPAGTNPTTTASLPVKSLNGEVDTFSQDYLLASKPWKSWTFNVHYRRYENDNKTEPILFPGYVAFVDSYWRSNIAGVPIENEVQSYTKTSTTAEAIWDISKKLRWKVGYEWEGWLREHRQVVNSDEHSIYTQFNFNPTNKFTSKFNYRYSDRKPEVYDPGVKEFAKLRMFDQARRLRHDADWQWQFAIDPKVGVSGTIGMLSDDYDDNFFGLMRYEQWYGSVDLLYMPKDNTTFYANYSRENYRHFTQTIAKTAVPYDLNNRWNRTEKDVLDNFGIGVTTYLAKDKVLLDLHYVYSNSVIRTTTVNPATPLANSVLNATAYPLPDVRSRFQEFNSDVSYQFNNNVALGFRYIFQPYTLDDFGWNGLTPYPYTQLTAEQDGARFLILDSRYSSSDVHIFGVYMRFGK